MTVEELLKQEPELEQTIRIFQIIANMTQSERYEVIDTGFFNSVIQAYTAKALDNYEVENKWDILREQRILMDEIGAEDIVKWYEKLLG